MILMAECARVKYPESEMYTVLVDNRDHGYDQSLHAKPKQYWHRRNVWRHRIRGSQLQGKETYDLRSVIRRVEPKDDSVTVNSGTAFRCVISVEANTML